MRRGNVIEIFGSCAAEFGDRSAIEHAGRKLTYAELDARSHSLANYLIARARRRRPAGPCSSHTPRCHHVQPLHSKAASSSSLDPAAGEEARADAVARRAALFIVEPKFIDSSYGSVGLRDLNFSPGAERDARGNGHAIG